MDFGSTMGWFTFVMALGWIALVVGQIFYLWLATRFVRAVEDLVGVLEGKFGTGSDLEEEIAAARRGERPKS